MTDPCFVCRHMALCLGCVLVLSKCVLQNIFLCVQQNKEMYTGLERHEGDEMITDFSFLGELSL